MLFFFLLACITNCLSCSDDLDGVQYSKINIVQRMWASALIEKIRQHPQTHILDIGCGTGEITADLARMHSGAKVLGIDPNASMLAVAREKFDRIKNVTWVESYIPNYFEKKARDELYSSVVSFSALHWLSYINLKKTLRASYQTLQPNGRCYFLFAGKQDNSSLDYLTRAVDSAIQDSRWADFFNKEDIDSLDDSLLAMKSSEFSQLCTEVGFTVEDIQLEEERYHFASAVEFKNWLDVMSPYKKIVGERHAQFVTAVIDAYLALCPAAENGSVVYKDYMLNVILKKID